MSACETENINKTKYSGPGWVKIKQEYINYDYKPTLTTDYLPNDIKAELEKTERIKEDDGGEQQPPPNKKAKKMTGCNKKRPRPNYLSPSAGLKSGIRLCTAMINGETCSYGSSCKFEHDAKVILENKLPDLPGSCYVYDVKGKCDMGIMCRFASNHLSENGNNLIDQEKLSLYKPTINSLDKDLLNQLRKQTYDYSKSIVTLKKLCVPFKDKGSVVTESKDACPLSKEDNNCSVNANNIIKSEPDLTPLKVEEKKRIDFRNKLFLAPLTTVGNLPFRRICKSMGADITCGEMAMALNLLKGQKSEWALLKRHPSEDIFGVQICGGFPAVMTKCSQMLCEQCDIDFIDINCGCPIDLVFKNGEGSGLMNRANRLESIIQGMSAVANVPITVKMRTGVMEGRNTADTLIPRLKDLGVDLVTVHGRSREQRYTRLADWNYIAQCKRAASTMPVFGNGDILTFEDYNSQMETSGVDGIMIARGALIKPWIFTEIKEQRHWDISSSERFDIMKQFCNYGLEHWGSDYRGVENTRKFLLEWLSFLYRYVPVGIMETVPQRINDRPPYFIGRDDLETLMGSGNCSDWIKLSEMLLGPVPDDFVFAPKHKANSYK